MRLIDADAFKENIGTETKLRKMICSAIDTQPTAYDVGNEYNKAIDDFAEKIADWCDFCNGGMRKECVKDDKCKIYEMADQLKG